MANGVNKPFGLHPVRYLNGSAWNGAANVYYATGGTDIFIGDPVVRTGTSAAAGTVISGRDCQGMPAVTVAAAAAVIAGVCVGVVPVTSEDTVAYTTGDRLILVVDDPNVVFQIQEDSVGESLLVTAVGNCADIATYAAPSSGSISAVVLDSSDKKNTTAQLKILGLSDLGSGKNDISTTGTDTKYAVFDVLINEHFYKDTAGI